MFKTNLFYFLLLSILIVFSVLGASDILNLKQFLLVEGFQDLNNSGAISITGPEDNTYFAARGPEGNVAYGNVMSDGSGSVTTYKKNDDHHDHDDDHHDNHHCDPNDPNYDPNDDKCNDDHHDDHNDHHDDHHDNNDDHHHNPPPPKRRSHIYHIENNDNIINRNIPPNRYNFIKKTQVVPPVCPACPYPPPPPNQLDENGNPVLLDKDGNPIKLGENGKPINSSNSFSPSFTLDQMVSQLKKEKCPPCPACERCPEPAFKCKKVPDYNSSASDNYLPMPVLNDFSTF